MRLIFNRPRSVKGARFPEAEVDKVQFLVRPCSPTRSNTHHDVSSLSSVGSSRLVMGELMPKSSGVSRGIGFGRLK